MNQSSTSLDEAVRGSLRSGKFQKFEPNIPEPIGNQKSSDLLIGLSSNLPDRPVRNWALRFLGPYLECNA